MVGRNRSRELVPQTGISAESAGGSGVARDAQGLDPLEARSRPELTHLVELLEGRSARREVDPRHLRARVDVDVGRDPRWIVERSRAHEPHLRPPVLAEDRDLARRAAEDALGAAVVPRHVDRWWVAGEHFDAIVLDQHVDDERAARLPLTVAAVTAVNEERVRRQPVANAPAGAAALVTTDSSHRHRRAMPRRTRRSRSVVWEGTLIVVAMVAMMPGDEPRRPPTTRCLA